MFSATDKRVEIPPPSTGPLHGVRVIEFSALGPAPFACMLLSDMGADVVTVARNETTLSARDEILNRGRRVVQADIKDKKSREGVLELLDNADVLVESFRPGVMERNELGPDIVHARNPELIYARITGYGQEGPLAKVAGHDINFLAITGALNAIGVPGGPPVTPLNILGDYAAGSLYLLAGILAALHERMVSGKGQVVEASITDGLFSLLSTYISHFRQGRQSLTPGQSLLDGGAPFYGVYETADGKYVSIGAIEPQFFQNLCELLKISYELRSSQYDKTQWPALKYEMTQKFYARTQREWMDRFKETDACFAPVLDLQEAMSLDHHQERKSFVQIAETLQPAPSPRFSRTPSSAATAAPNTILLASEILRSWKK